MKKIISLPIFVFILFLVSCDTINVLDNQPTVKIPLDSIFFSCKIDNQQIEFQSPGIKGGTWSEGAARLNKIKNSTKDSVLMCYSKGFQNERYIVEFSFSETILLDIDTACFGCTEIPSQRSLLLRKGIRSLQFLERFHLNEPISQYCGFRIEIKDLNKNITYTSNIGDRDPNISTDYKDFASKSQFEIAIVLELYQNAWFINSQFRCKLYINSKSSETAMLTDGVLNCMY